ncbi:MAG: protein translocase subunit SecD [Planctomycetaceae bacterium]|nr:protein translocase subunit SecD [Planctomycetaceae bacterium]
MLAQAITETVEAVTPAATNWMGWMQDPWIYGGLFVAAIVISTVVGNLIARASRMDDSGWRFAIVLGSILVSLLVLGSKWPPRFGVDLKGGTVIIGQVDNSKIDANDPNSPESGSFQIDDLIRQLKNRIDPTGLLEIVIRSQGNDKIEVVIPDVDAVEAERIWNKMNKIGFLQFRMVAIDLGEGVRAKELASKQAESADASIRRSRTVMEPATGDEPAKVIASWYDIGRTEVTAASAAEGVTPAYRMVPLPSSLVRDGATGRIVLPTLYQRANNGAELKELAEAQGITQLQILLLEPLEDRFRVDGEHVHSTRAGSQGFDPIVEFTMTSAGASNMYRFTDYFRPVGQAKHFMAVVLDGSIMTAPSLNSPIQDRGIIEGNFTKTEVEDVVSILNAGRIPVALKKDYISLDSVQSNLGVEMQQKGLYAMVASLVLVLIFMLVYYYEWSGAIACVALLLNILLLCGSIMAVGQAITLTGLAGFVLIVGMSVDANVLIFERIREEMAKGTALRMAIRNGFDRATTTIIDANVTTMITAVVLYVIGTEQLKSFAVVLILGILTGMFTAVFVARVCFDWLERRRMIKSLRMMQVFKAERLNVVALGRVLLPLSGIVVLVSIVLAFVRGGEIFDYDLRGGSTVRCVMVAPTTQQAVAEELKKQKVVDENGLDVPIGVSELISEDYPNGTYFKVESTLSVAEGEQNANFRDLKQVLKDTFGDRLIRLEVEATPVREVGAAATPATSQGSVRPWPSLSAPVYTSLPVSIQEQEPPQEQKSAEGATPAAETQADATKSEATKAEGSETESTAPPQEAAKSDAVTPPATNEAAPGPQTPELPPTVLPPVPNTTPAGPQDASPTTPQDTTATAASSGVLGEFELTFKLDVATETVQGQLVSIADELDLGIPEEGIFVTAASGLGRDKKFSVQVRASNLADIQTVVDRMTTQLSSEPYFPSASSFGSQVAGRAQLQALAALLASLVGIVLYIWFRFQHVWFGLAAVAALIHDVAVVIGAIAVSHWIYGMLGGALLIDDFKISLSVVAALLTVVGYSLNDTIIVFDRIREVRGRSHKFTGDMIDISIAQTLSRTILTSLTTFLVVVVLFGWGGESIHSFAFSLAVGIIVGTYSSIFVASPILLYLMRYKFIDMQPVVEGKLDEA